MVLAFIALFMFDVVVGVGAYCAWKRVTDFLRAHPESAKLFSECVLTPLLTGKTDNPEVKKVKGTLV